MTEGTCCTHNLPPLRSEFEAAHDEMNAVTALACIKWWSALPKVVQQKWLADPKTPTMAHAWTERCKRQEAADFSLASVQLEGFNPSAYVQEQTRRHINGEIDLQEFLPQPLFSTPSTGLLK